MSGECPAWTHRRVSSGDVELAVVEAGDPAAPTVLLVHGYPDTKEVWSELAAHLTDRFHVVAYDVRGAGASSAPRGLRNYDLERLTDDALAVIAAICPGRQVHLVGHDWGSVQGWEVATSSRSAPRVASFTSISGPSLDHVGHWIASGVDRRSPRRLLAAAGQGVRSWYVAVLHVPLLPELAWRTVLARRWPHSPDGYPGATLGRDGASGARLYRRNVVRRIADPRPDAHAAMPVQLTVPAKDRYLSERIYDDLDRWAPVLLRRKVVAGHWVIRSHSSLIADWIADFAEHYPGAPIP